MGERRSWVHDLNVDRERFGEFYTLYEDLRIDEERFWRYFRMSIATFDYILEAIRSAIAKKNTNYRQCISPEERLMVTIR